MQHTASLRPRHRLAHHDGAGTLVRTVVAVVVVITTTAPAVAKPAEAPQQHRVFSLPARVDTWTPAHALAWFDSLATTTAPVLAHYRPAWVVNAVDGACLHASVLTPAVMATDLGIADAAHQAALVDAVVQLRQYEAANDARAARDAAARDTPPSSADRDAVNSDLQTTPVSAASSAAPAASVLVVDPGHGAAAGDALSEPVLDHAAADARSLEEVRRDLASLAPGHFNVTGDFTADFIDANARLTLRQGPAPQMAYNLRQAAYIYAQIVVAQRGLDWRAFYDAWALRTAGDGTGGSTKGGGDDDGEEGASDADIAAAFVASHWRNASYSEAAAALLAEHERIASGDVGYVIAEAVGPPAHLPHTRGSTIVCNRFKLRHDIAQLRYLQRMHRLPAAVVDAMVAPLEAVERGRRARGAALADFWVFTPAEWRLVRGVYNRHVYEPPPPAPEVVAAWPRLPQPAARATAVDAAAADATQRQATETTAPAASHSAPSAGAQPMPRDAAHALVVLNRDVPWPEAEACYLGATPHKCVVDDFLSSWALRHLLRVARESTLFFDVRSRYVGAYLSAGLTSPVLLRLVDELRVAMPRVVGALPLVNAWFYVYGDIDDNDDDATRSGGDGGGGGYSGGGTRGGRATRGDMVPARDGWMRGISAHADDALVNLNIWLAPDDANLDSASGGLIVYDSRPEDGFDLALYNEARGTEALAALLEGAASTTVPHRQNRCVAFDSALLHETDRMRFAPGFECRRVNLTLLFGRRKTGREAQRSPRDGSAAE